MTEVMLMLMMIEARAGGEDRGDKSHNDIPKTHKLLNVTLMR
jgi:hypothetical protein